MCELNLYSEIGWTTLYDLLDVVWNIYEISELNIRTIS